jgi:hypothetical protein
VLFLVSLATFFLLELVPGDPAVSILVPTPPRSSTPPSGKSWG